MDKICVTRVLSFRLLSIYLPGSGKISYKDGSYYRGDMQKNQMWGHGIYVGSDNTQYDGEWRANMRQGVGTALYSDGRYRM